MRGLVGEAALLVDEEGNEGGWPVAVVVVDVDGSSVSDVEEEEEDEENEDGDGAEPVVSCAKAAVGDEVVCDSIVAVAVTEWVAAEFGCVDW